MTQFLGPTMALTMSTIAFTICFACWVLNGVLITYLVNTNIFAFTTAEVGWLLAVPFLTGSISRLPLGVLTDRYGGRTVFFWLMIASAVPLYLVSHARGFGDLLWAGAGFGLTGGGFAVGVGYVAAWFSKQMQGTALGIFGMGNAGAALNTMVTPSLLIWLTDTGADPEHWRQLPRLYAAVLVLVAMLFFVLTKDKRPESASGTGRTTLTLLAPLADIRVWRFGLYYFLVFGAFVAVAQWLVPYSVNVYGISIVQAGFIASLFSFPSGVIRAAGGWLSDRFGARTVMYWSFMSCAVSCAFLAVPRMEIVSPGFGVTAAAGGAVTAVSPTAIGVGARTYALKPPVETLPARTDTGDMVWLSITRWHEPVVKPGETVVQGQLLARGVTNIYYPANIWLFVFAVTVFGIATGIAKAGVYKFIPDYYPESVGLVGGIIGMIGALGGFVLPPVFGYLMGITGVWATCWLFLTLVSLTCLWWMQYTIRSILKAEAPNLTQLVEFRPRTAILKQEPAAASEATTVEGLLRQVPIFSHLTPEELKSLAGIGRLQTVEAQTILLREGD
ncbi:MAG: NarK/NasA family nitrate transporter, partial [Acidimicrobiia bacterium]|nr:NarK/NasA family nitrate transporter [Acidimicrobiia bacterium]